MRNTLPIKAIIVGLLSPIFLFSQQKSFSDNWKSRTYQSPQQVTQKILSISNTPSASVTINVDNKVAPVLTTQFGVNTPFRNGSDQQSRNSMYNGVVSAIRYPAGSGSNTFFFDGNVPSTMSNYIDQSSASQSVQGIVGTQKSTLTPTIFCSFKTDINSDAIVVVNYFYARYGKTLAGTRAARVQQAANYAADFVRQLNIEQKANVRYWEIGNECYGKWEVGYNVDDPTIGTVTGKEYGEDFRVFAAAMKAVDPTIKVGAIAEEEDAAWNAGMLPEVQNSADFLSVHEYFTTVNAATANNILGSVGMIGTIRTNVQNCVSKYTTKAPNYFPIALTEFNSRGPYNCTMVNGVFVSQILGEVIKNNIGLSTLWVSEWNWSATDNESKGFLAKSDPDQADYTARQAYIPYFYYAKCFGDYMVESTSNNSNVTCYASTFSSGETGIVLVNSSANTQTVRLNLNRNSLAVPFNKYQWYEFYGNPIDVSVTGYKKFYINGITSTSLGGGPDNLNNVLPYESSATTNGIFTMRPYSVNYIVAKTALTTAISTSTTATQPTISPSLVFDRCKVSPTEGLQRCEVYSIDGKLKGSFNGCELYLSHLQKGYYLVKLYYLDCSYSTKIVKL